MDHSQSNDGDGSSSDEDPLHDYEEDESSDEKELSYFEDSDDEDDVIQEEAEAQPRRHSRPPTTAYNPDTIFMTGKKGGLRLKAIKILASDIILPSTHEEAMASCYADMWRQAEPEEIEGLRSRNTFKAVPIPQHATKWLRVFPQRRCSKARLVAKGYSQKNGRDYFETYAPVGNSVGHRIFDAMAASRCTIPRNADCTQALVNADSDVLTYIKPPAGIQDVEVGEFLALHKSLYGLKQSSRNWYLLVSKWLTERKWEMFCNDECIWRKNDEFTFFHVDDFHYLLQSEESYQEWFKEFSLPFPAKDLGTSSQILGMNLRYLEDGSISLDQERY